MVSILPSNRTPWDTIGESIGQNLSATLPQAAAQRSERQTGLEAIDQLQSELERNGGDIRKALPALMKAQTLNKSLERSALTPKALEYAGAGMYGPALGEGSGASNQVDQNFVNNISEETQQAQPPQAELGSKNSSANIDSIANQYLGEVRPDLVNPETQYGAINTFDSELKQDLSPQEESRLRQQLMDKYHNPNVVNSVVDRLREGIKNRFNEAQAKYGFDTDKRNQIQEKWKKFTEGTAQRLAPHLNKYDESYPRTKEVLTGKYNQYAGASSTNMTPEQMHTNAMALLQNDLNKLDALAAIPSAPPFRNENDAREYIDNNKDTYKDLAERGLTEALREDALINKDLGNEEFHSLIWGDQTSKPLLNQLHSFKAPKEYKNSPDKRLTTKYNPAYPQEKQKYLDDISSTLMKLNPNDDLMLARAMVLDSGGDIQDFTKALKQAQDNGLKLSEFQKSQLQEVNIPRVPPLYELFSNERFSMPVLKAWTPWINYMRGKK